MFKTELYDNVFVSDLMTNAPAIIIENESMENVMKLFDETGAWNLPVIKNGKYVGFVSKSSIFSSYRNKLKVNKIE
jgi:CIC family chloride channel protein